MDKFVVAGLCLASTLTLAAQSTPARSGNETANGVMADDASVGTSVSVSTPLDSTGDGTAVSTSMQSLPNAPAPNPKHDEPIAAVTAGFAYLLSDLTNQEGPSKNLLGWYILPQVNFTKHIGAVADFVNVFNEKTGPSANTNGLHSNIRAFVAGPLFMFPVGKKLVPFAFAEAGSIRTSQPASSPTWSPAVLGGFGANYSITRRLAFQFVPFEYVAEDQANPNGTNTWTQNFNPKAGITLNFFGSR